MAALAETQSPLLERDVRCGLIPSKLPCDSDEEYLHRLMVIYYAPRDAILRALGRL